MAVKPDTGLFDLIKSLKKQEKIELHKFAFSNKTDSVYLKVYNAIDSLTIYDEAIVIKKSGVSKNRLPEVKNYLYNIILRSLVIMHGNNISFIETYRDLSQVQVLKYKGLFDQSIKKLNSVIKKADFSEDYLTLITCLAERDIINAVFTKKYKTEKEIDKSFNELLCYIRHFSELTYQRFLYAKSLLPISYYEKENFLLNINVNKNELNFNFNNEPDTFYKKILWFRTQCRMEILKKNFKKAKGICEKALAYFEKQKNKNILPTHLINGFSNVLMNASFGLGNYEETKKHLNDMEVLLMKTGKKYIDNLDYFFLNGHKMSLYVATGKMEEAMKISKFFFEKNKTRLEEIREQNDIYNYNLLHIFFGLNDIEKFSKLIKRLIYLDYKFERKDLYCRCLILEALAVIETKNYYLLDSKIRNLERQLKANNAYGDYEKIICSFLRAHINTDINYEFYQKQHQIILKKLENLYNVNYYDRYFNIRAWLNSKINKRNYIEEIKDITS